MAYIYKAFDDVDVALLVGSKPRGPGQERADLLRENGVIFKQQADALNKYARDCVKVTVVWNPANILCFSYSKYVTIEITKKEYNKNKMLSPIYCQTITYELYFDKVFIYCK